MTLEIFGLFQCLAILLINSAHVCLQVMLGLYSGFLHVSSKHVNQWLL